MILTDYQMPSMNGDTLVKEIRKINPVVPIVGLSGSSQYNSLILKAGANQAFPKGYISIDDIGDILDSVKENLDIYRKHYKIKL